MFKGVLMRFLNTIALLTTTPFDILSQEDLKGKPSSFVRAIGAPALGQVLSATGILSAAIIILSSLAILRVANYPKTVAQTKEKIVNALMVVAFLAAFPLIADAIYTVVVTAFY